MTNELLQQAYTQSEQCIARALAADWMVCRTKSRLCERGTIVNVVCRALHLDGDVLCTQLDLSGTWLQSVSCDNGFLNFTLSEQWYNAISSQAFRIEPFPPLPNVKIDFPAMICAEDFYFASVLGGKALQPVRMARRDKCNVGWLIRCTAERLAVLEQRTQILQCDQQIFVWTEPQKALIRQLACFDADAKPNIQVGYLCDLCERLWAYRLEALPYSLNRFAQAVLNAGRLAVVEAKSKISFQRFTENSSI